MSRLIDGDALKDWLEIVPLTGDGGVDINDLVEHIDLMPSAQPKRKRGHWRVTPMACYGGGTLTECECSECEVHQIAVSNFCPNCGADMRGEQE